MTTATREWHGKNVPLVPKHYSREVTRQLVRRGDHVLTSHGADTDSGKVTGKHYDASVYATVYSVRSETDHHVHQYYRDELELV
jgi:hypothetical protein